MQHFSVILISWCVIWCVPYAAAQPAAVKIPRLGFAWDGRSNQIRPIHGIPGAAILGEGTGKTSYASVVISPRHDLALAISAENGKVQAIRLSSGDVQDVPGIAAPFRLIFSPSGTAGLAVGPRLQLLTGLPDTITVQDLALPPDAGAPTAIAVSDDAQLVLFSARSGDTSSTWLLAPGMSPFQVAVPGPIAVASFQPGARDAVALDPDGTVYRILNSAIPGEVRLFYAGSSQTADPVAVRVSADGRRVYTANRLGTLTVIDPAAISVDAVDCGCGPTGIEPLSSSNLFRVTEISDRPVMLFDVSTPTPRVWFVPADAPLADSQRSGQ
jgi:DNA-binding beta-propeller fold protein YncE